MSAYADDRGSVWLATGTQPAEFARLEGEVEADVAVLGGGIVGITTALMLQERGVRRRAGRGRAAWRAA